MEIQRIINVILSYTGHKSDDENDKTSFEFEKKSYHQQFFNIEFYKCKMILFFMVSFFLTLFAHLDQENREI